MPRSYAEYEELNVTDVDDSLDCCSDPTNESSSESPDEMAEVVFPNLEFRVTKWHHRRRWLRQERLLRLTQRGIENVNLGTGITSKSNKYRDITDVKLVNHRYLILSFKKDHSYHYKTECAIRVCWEINERLKVLRAKERFRDFVNSRMQEFPPHAGISRIAVVNNMSRAFRTNKIPLPIDRACTLMCNRQESITEYNVTEILLNKKSPEGKLLITIQSKIDGLLKNKQCTGLQLLHEVRRWIQDLKVEVLDLVLGTDQMSTNSSFRFTPPSNLSFGGDVVHTSHSDSGTPYNQRLCNRSIRIDTTPKGYKSKFIEVEHWRINKSWAEGGCGTEDEISATVENVLQSLILTKHTQRLFEEIMSDPTLAKKRQTLAEKVKLIRNKPLSFFGVTDTELEKCNWTIAIKELEKIGEGELPSHKIDALMLMVRKICLIHSIDTHAQPTEMSLDDILPLFLFCISRCQLPEILAEAEFMATLSDTTSSNEGAYFITVLFSALEYIIMMEMSELQPAIPDSNNNSNNSSLAMMSGQPTAIERLHHRRAMSAPPKEQMIDEDLVKIPSRIPRLGGSTQCLQPDSDTDGYAEEPLFSPRNGATTPPLVWSDFADVEHVW